MPPLIEFDTERLAFRRWADRHRGPFAALNADPEVMRHFPATLTPAESNGAIDRWLDQFDRHGWSQWAVECRDTGALVGFVGLSVPRWPLPFGPCVEIGWRLARSCWGLGYATEGARAVLRVGYERIGLEEIVSFTALENVRSRAVMERIGMVDAQADFDHPALPEGHSLRRHCLYRLARADWRARLA